MNKSQIIKVLILTPCFLAGAFIHGFLSVDYLATSYFFSLALGAVLWHFGKTIIVTMVTP